jgi:hypothetical protein
MFTRPTPWASYQCSSARRTRPLLNRTNATPLHFLQRPGPCRRRSRARSRIPRPAAIVRISVIGLTSSNGTAVLENQRARASNDLAAQRGRAAPSAATAGGQRISHQPTRRRSRQIVQPPRAHCPRQPPTAAEDERTCSELRENHSIRIPCEPGCLERRDDSLEGRRREFRASASRIRVQVVRFNERACCIGENVRDPASFEQTISPCGATSGYRFT